MSETTSTTGARAETENDSAYIATYHLSKTFELGQQWIQPLDNVSITIEKSRFTAIMGPSGSGKSTLLYLLGGLDRPTSGVIEVAGNRLDMMTGEELAEFRQRTVGFVFQQFHLVPTMTALENVALPGVFAALPRDARERRAEKLLYMLGMGDRLDHRPSQLSGGQQQRVAIARALFNNPPVIMADEPTGALDSKNGKLVVDLLCALCRRRGKTIILVSHDPAVTQHADRVLYLRDGRIIDDYAPDEREEPRHDS